MITHSIKRDLNSKTNPDEQCLALTAIANIGGKEQAEALSQDVQKLLVSAYVPWYNTIFTFIVIPSKLLERRLP